jgi:outer membrane receptor for ferrienterochelin and colicins
MAVAIASVLQAGTPGVGVSDPAQRLDPLVVTGTRTTQRLSETPIRTEVLGDLELRLASPRTLADAIELLPGARVENNCQNCGTSQILLLGLEQKYTQLLFDGAPLFTGLAGVYGIDQIPALFLDRIEVVKGGGSSIYGSGAVGGVINLIGRRPNHTCATGEVRFESVKGQPILGISGVLDHVSADGRSLLSVYGQIVRGEPVDLNHDGFSDLTRKKLRVAGARFVQRIGKGELRTDVSRTLEHRRGGNKLDLPDNLADVSERIDTERDALTAAWSDRVSPDLDYQIAAGYARIDRQTFYGGLFGHAQNERLVGESAAGVGDNDQAYLDRGYATWGQVALDQFGYTKNWVGNVDAQANRQWGQHLVSFGAQYFREKISDRVPVSEFVREFPVRADVAVGDNVGVFVQDDWRVAERWRLVLGVRGDKNSELARTVFSPRINVKWQATKELTLRGTIGTGFRAPQAFDEDLHIELIAGDRTKTVQARNLAEEKSHSALLSAGYEPRFADGRLAFESTAFLTRIRGTFTNSEVRTDPISGEAFRERFNGPGAEVGGIELNIGALPLPKLRVDLGLVAQFARFKQPVTVYDDGAGRVVDERDFLETPRRYAVLQLTWRQPQFADVAVSATYTGRMKDINQRTGDLNSRTRDFLVWNATVSRRFERAGWPNVTLSAGIRNAFDQRQRDLEAGVDRDPYYLYGPRTPRSLFASARVEF